VAEYKVLLSLWQSTRLFSHFDRVQGPSLTLAEYKILISLCRVQGPTLSLADYKGSSLTFAECRVSSFLLSEYLLRSALTWRIAVDGVFSHTDRV
jgi:hypothetical protein